ncbi:MAG: NTP/NDP exchange transporter [Bradymonadia bacterium]
MSATERKSPLKAILDIRRQELPLALSMFGYFFLVITTFWILKPLKKGLFIQHYDATGFSIFGAEFSASEAELLAKVANMFVAFVAVVAFTWLVRHFRRQQLTLVFSAFFGVCFVAYNMLLGAEGGPGSGVVWSFYLFGDLYSTLMVATFFAFMNDSVDSDKAKRLYGLVGLGGVAGGVFGTTTVRTQIKNIELGEWMWVSLAIALFIAALALYAGRLVDRDPPPAAPKKEEAPKKAGNPAFEGAALVFRSKYLLSVVAIVGLYEIASTVMDFQFTATIAHYLDGPAIGEQFATVYTITNIASLVVQLLLTSFVMTRFGVGIALMILPAAILLGSAVFVVAPVLWVGSLLNTTDNAFSYSINQSAKEALYVPTTSEEKYKAKAFIDMFVQRFAKAIAVGVSLGLGAIADDFSALRWLSGFTIVVVLLWLVAVRYVGREFKEMEGR